jgi:phage I-like protein
MIKTSEPIQLLPFGWFLQDGIAWSVDNEIAMTLLAKLRSRIDDYVVDFEHQTMMASDNGLPAPAAGWIRPYNLQWRHDQGLFGVVEWTKNAKPGDFAAIAPCFSTNHGGPVLDILLWGLTNNPKLIIEPVSVELSCQKEWDGSAALRNEFGSLDVYGAYRRGMERQRRR